MASLKIITHFFEQCFAGSPTKKAAGSNSGAVFHNLRHTFISNLLNVDGVPMATVMKLAGHRKMQATMGYTHSLDSLLKQAVGGLAM
jgi:integrase